MTRVNEFGQPIGEAFERELPLPSPARVTLRGTRCVIEPLNADAHAAQLFAEYAAAADESHWTYTTAGPFAELGDYRAWAESAAASADPLHFAVVNRETGAALGTMALASHDPGSGVVEIGYISFSRPLQRTAMATEAHFLLMSYVFDELGYRRLEWKCDSLNEPSRRAAERLGYQFEGTFRQAKVYKGRSRDSHWFSIIDSEWPGIKAEFERWLDPANFDAAGTQLTPLRQRL